MIYNLSEFSSSMLSKLPYFSELKTDLCHYWYAFLVEKFDTLTGNAEKRFLCFQQEHPKFESELKQYLTSLIEIAFSPHFIQNSDSNLHALIDKQTHELLIKTLHSDASKAYAIKKFIHILEKFLINRLNESYYIPHPPKPPETILESAASFMWRSCQDRVERSKLFVNKFAFAHGLIQYTGWSTQNENSIFALFDLYNYVQYADGITEYTNIFLGILQPLYPIYYEFKDASLKEKNVFLRVSRLLMPTFIASGILVGVGCLLGPLAIPEIAFVVLSIPLLYLGLFLAAQFIRLKNYFYELNIQLNYGDRYLSPAFEINERLQLAFGIKAYQVQQYYIQEMKACDEKSAQLKAKGNLTSSEIEEREATQERRRLLSLEWIDLHDNQELGYDALQQIFHARVMEDIYLNYPDFLQAYHQDEQAIRQGCQKIEKHLMDNLEQIKLSEFGQDSLPSSNLSSISIFAQCKTLNQDLKIKQTLLEHSLPERKITR